MSHPTMAHEAKMVISGAVIMIQDSCLLHHLRGRATSGLDSGDACGASERVRDSGFRIQDSGFRICQPRLTNQIRGKGYGIQDAGFTLSTRVDKLRAP